MDNSHDEEEDPIPLPEKNSDPITLLGIVSMRHSLSFQAMRDIIALLQLKLDWTVLKNLEHVLGVLDLAKTTQHIICSDCGNDLSTRDCDEEW